MWPSCKHPTTQSFCSPSAAAKTIASLFLDSAESSFANSSARTHHVDCASDILSTESEASAAAAADDMADAIVRGLRSDDRLLFEPSAPSSSILERKPPAAADQAEAASSFGGSVAVTFESVDPCRDFRASMEEMVAAHGAGDWDWLERMLVWYLGANSTDTHPAIITAFVDLVVSMAASASGCACNSSRVSSFTLPSSEPAESSTAGGQFSIGLR